MKFSETLKLALAAIRAHKLRSALTLLGMIIGVTAVVVVVSMIQGFNTYVDEKIANIGSKAFSVYRFDFFNDFKNTDTLAAAQRRNTPLTLEEYDYIRTRAQVVDRLGAQAFPSRAEVKRGNITLQAVPVSGATANVAEIKNIEIADGRYFTDAENDAATRVCFLGSDIADKLFPSGGAINQEIYVRGIPYRVVGVAVEKGTVFGQPQDTYINVPLKTYARTFGPLINQRSLYFVGKAKSDDLFADAVEEARTLLRTRRRLPGSEKDNFAIITPDAITGARDRIFGPIFIVAIAVPGIALVVGGIVIMNIMLVSVTERTKEIGIRKAIGARRGDILKQFLVEAITLSAIGGAVGVLLAWIIGLVISNFFLPTRLSITAIIIAVTVSGGIGVLSGIFPAWKAARLDPIEALRAD
ncbi:MAG: ABC transporter permease [Pyrinomonadaceae bacterium]|nr:ABC transporter permease [Pyrinomonadaceae bacterium]